MDATHDTCDISDLDRSGVVEGCQFRFDPTVRRGVEGVTSFSSRSIQFGGREESRRDYGLRGRERGERGI
jgi:hypothetical protein